MTHDDKITLDERERALIAPAMQRVAHHAAAHRAAVAEVKRLLAMRTGWPVDSIGYDATTFTVWEVPRPEAGDVAGNGEAGER